MGRRLVLALVAMSWLLAACESTERLEIRADGSSTLTSGFTIERDDVVPGGVFDFDELRDAARDDPAAFVERVFALESADDLPGEFSADVTDDQVTIAWVREYADLSALEAQLAEDWSSPALAGASFERAGSTIRLEADVPEHLSVFWREFFAFGPEVDPFRPEVLDDDVALAVTQALEIALPGRVVSHDAHDSGGDALRWSWTLGEPAQPGVSVMWDPDDEPENSFDWWGRDQAIVFGFLALGLLVLLVGGSLGFLGFTRKLEKEGRRVRSGRWPRP